MRMQSESAHGFPPAPFCCFLSVCQRSNWSGLHSTAHLFFQAVAERGELVPLSLISCSVAHVSQIKALLPPLFALHHPMSSPKNGKKEEKITCAPDSFTNHSKALKSFFIPLDYGMQLPPHSSGRSLAGSSLSSAPGWGAPW